MKIFWLPGDRSTDIYERIVLELTTNDMASAELASDDRLALKELSRSPRLSDQLIAAWIWARGVEQAHDRAHERSSQVGNADGNANGTAEAK
jgi:hypothetical protein